MADESIERMFERARELKDGGLDFSQAHGIAWLEERIRRWPPAWGDDLQVVIYGDFQVPASPLEFPDLGITVFPEKQKNTIIRGAMTVLKAKVTVPEKNVTALLDAARRINLLLGAFTLCDWGNTGIGWWSWVTHEGSGGAMGKWRDGTESLIQGMLNLKPDVRKKLEAALFWIRESRNLVLESYRSNALRTFSNYWNAFECLVEAVNIVRPVTKLPKEEKQALIDAFVEERGSKLSPADIEECYRTIVNKGFVGKASHALTVCFGEHGSHYEAECFRLPNRQDRLYDIRNAINHGEIDAENPQELLRVEARFRRLWMIVFRMFGSFVPFGVPVDSKLQQP